MALVLYHNDMSVCAQKVRLALAEKGLAYEARHFNLRAGDQKDPAYLKLNPKGVVPTLVDDATVVTELIVINEYLDDAFTTPPLKPADAAGRARMRWWTKHIDDGVFSATATVSMSIAFIHQFPPEVIEELVRLRGPTERQRFEQLRKGVDNPAFPQAAKRLYKMVGDMAAALENSPWLVGTEFTLADIAYAPYITRLDHLKLMGMLDRFPRVWDWYDRMRSRSTYQSAIAAYVNPKYLPLMEEKGNEAWPKVATILRLE